MKRALQKYVEDEMAEMILRTGMKEGDTVLVDFDSENQKVVMEKVEEKEKVVE